MFFCVIKEGNGICSQVGSWPRVNGKSEKPYGSIVYEDQVTSLWIGLSHAIFMGVLGSFAGPAPLLADPSCQPQVGRV